MTESEQRRNNRNAPNKPYVLLILVCHSSLTSLEGIQCEFALYLLWLEPNGLHYLCMCVWETFQFKVMILWQQALTGTIVMQPKHPLSWKYPLKSTPSYCNNKLWQWRLSCACAINMCFSAVLETHNTFSVCEGVFVSHPVASLGLAPSKNRVFPH